MQDLKTALQVSDLSIEDTGLSSNELTGIVHNTSDTLFHYVEVQLNAYDNDGYQVDSVIASVNNLEPGGKWKLNAPMSNRGADVKLIRIIADDGDKEGTAVFVP